MCPMLYGDILPTLLVGSLAGPFVDRLSRRGLMIGADLARFGVFCALPFAPNATTIVGLAAVIGLAPGSCRPAVSRGLPTLVADEDLPRANSLLQMIDNSTWAIGSLVGGALVAAQGPDLAYWINAATFLVSASLLAQIPRRLLQEARAETRGHWRDLADGLVLVRRSRALLTVLIAWNVGMVANAFVNVGEPFLATDSFSAGSFGLGLMMGSAGIGLAAGAYLAGSWIDARGLANIYGVSLGLMALGVAGAAASPNVWVAAVCVIVSVAASGARGGPPRRAVWRAGLAAPPRLHAGVARCGCPSGRQACSRARDHARRELGPARVRARSRRLPGNGARLRGRDHGPSRRRQVEPDLVARPPRPRGRQDGRRHLRRPLEPLLAGGAARRPDPSLRPFPRSRGVHPLDGDPRTPRRPRGSDAAGAARPRRRRQGARLSRDGRGRPKRGRGDRDRRYRRARADARLGRLDPGAEGWDHGDPGRDRDQQDGSPSGQDDAERGAVDPLPRQGPCVAASDRPDRRDARGECAEALGAHRSAPRLPRRRGAPGAAAPRASRRRGVRSRIGAREGVSRARRRRGSRAAPVARRGAESRARPAHGGSRDH